MQTIVRPVLHPVHEVDGTRRLVAAIADDLRRRCGKDGRIDEAAADRHLESIVARARKDAAKQPSGSAERTARPQGELERPGRATRNVPRRVIVRRETVRVGLVARVRDQIREGSYESDTKLDAALNGLAKEFGI